MPDTPRERMPTLERFDRYGDDARTPAPRGRVTMPAGRVLIVLLVALLVWGALYAPSLKRASEAQPLGARRTVSLWLLRPVAAISDFVQLTSLTDGAIRALGRDPNEAPGGAVDVPEPEDLPTLGPGVSVSPKPEGPVLKDTKIRRPTPTNELRVAVVGDSLAAGLGVYLEREFRPALVRLTRQGRISTGLSRLDYFDWMTAMRQIENGFARETPLYHDGIRPLFSIAANAAANSSTPRTMIVWTEPTWICLWRRCGANRPPQPAQIQFSPRLSGLSIRMVPSCLDVMSSSPSRV